MKKNSSNSFKEFLINDTLFFYSNLQKIAIKSPYLGGNCIKKQDRVLIKAGGAPFCRAFAGKDTFLSLDSFNQ